MTEGREEKERHKFQGRSAQVAVPSPTLNHRQHPINAVLLAPDVYPHKYVACQVNFHGRSNLCLPQKKKKPRVHASSLQIAEFKKERGEKRREQIAAKKTELGWNAVKIHTRRWCTLMRAICLWQGVFLNASHPIHEANDAAERGFVWQNSKHVLKVWSYNACAAVAVNYYLFRARYL